VLPLADGALLRSVASRPAAGGVLLAARRALGPPQLGLQSPRLATVRESTVAVCIGVHALQHMLCAEGSAFPSLSATGTDSVAASRVTHITRLGTSAACRWMPWGWRPPARAEPTGLASGDRSAARRLAHMLHPGLSDSRGLSVWCT